MALILKSAVPVKLAVTLLGAVMLRVCGVVVPVRAPLNPTKEYPALGAALTTTESPLLYQPLPGLIIPPPAGLTLVVK